MGIQQLAIDVVLEDVASRARVVWHASLGHEPSHNCDTEEKVSSIYVNLY